MKGAVVRSTGKWYEVITDKGARYQCRIKGRFRLNGLPLTNPVAVGDTVHFDLEDVEEKSGIITKIEERENYLVRQSPRKKHFLHLMASNVTQAVIVTTLIEPTFKQGFVDRFMVLTEPFNIPTIIVVNKLDLFDEGLGYAFEELKRVYNEIGYEVMAVSAQTGEGLDALKARLKDHRTVIGGQSGVGKSSLLNTIQPNTDVKVMELSNFSGKGQHTTTFATMYELDFGGQLIDTPGIKNLSFNNLTKSNISHNFKEYFVRSEHCKFSNCLHQNEPDCKVKEDLEAGVLNINRYYSYLAILNEIDEQNRWEKVDY